MGESKDISIFYIPMEVQEEIMGMEKEISNTENTALLNKVMF